ncbi:MMPL family transporter [Nocardia sp. IBHARD005]|uniref:MMPL family transporter n=1 Tax=Nocardia sp. IBHARD005 TaxID=3457765 RepID=UPI004058555F
MFTRWGDLVYRFRFAVIVVVGGAMLALGAYGMGLGPRLTQSGWFDPGSESVQGAQIADGSYGRDHQADVIVMYNAPEGKTIDDPEFQQKVVASLTKVVAEHPDQIGKINGTYWKVGDAPSVPSTFGSKDKKHAFASIAIAGDNDTVMMANYRAVADVFTIPGVDVEVSGLQPIAVTLTDTIDHDSKRMEVLAFPAVAILLFFIFGGIIAAALPLIIGGLTIVGATGIVMVLTNFAEVNSFVTGVVSMIGLGLAIDYGLFIVSRFREELAEGYSTPAAVRRSVMTAGRTVVFSATMIIASLGGVLIFPQGFLRSVAYGTIAAVSLAALTAITILPAMLGILGPRVDALGLKRFRKTKTAEQVENGFWGILTRWVMRHPLKIAIPITIGLLLLIIPVKDLAFGGINEKYLPPDNPTRSSLEHFYEVFPLKKTDPIQLVFVSDNTNAIGKVWKEANQAPGLVGPFEVPVKSPTNPEVFRTSATLVDPTGGAEPTIDYLRSIEVPDGVTMYVTGQPALMADSIDTLLELMPWMILLVLVTTTVLMFLTFGSLVLPIKAALMSALGLGATLGILTWIFVDGNGAGLLNFTPQPISAPVLMLIIAIIYGLSTDYEVFLLSRMVEARAQGASTTEAVRIGTAQTGRIITAAALILLVVTGAFAFSDMVMMQYIAYGMIAALFIDATILRMLLVPAIMKLLGDDCWWAPKWMKRIQEKIGLGEPILDDERPEHGGVVDLVKTTPITDPPTMQMTAVPDSKLARTPRRPRTVAEIEAEAPTQRIDKITDAESAESARVRQPMSPDPTRPRASMLSSGEPTRELPVVKPSTPAKADQEDAAKQEESGLDLPKYVSGEPTQVLPIMTPNTPDPIQGHEDSTPDTAANEDRGYSGPSFGTPPIDLGDPETGPGGATRPTNGLRQTNGTAESPSGSSPFGDTDFAAPGNAGVTGPSFGPDSRFGPAAAPDADFGSAENPGGPSISRPSPVDSGSGLDLPGIVSGVTPRGSARVQPPAGYTPGVIGETPPPAPRVPTPNETGDGAGFDTPPVDLPPRPSIVPPARPSMVTPPPRGIVPPQAPRIVNTPPTQATPAPRAGDTPPSGAFNGFSPVTASNLRPVAPDSPAPDSGTPAEPSRPSDGADAAVRDTDSRPHGFEPPSPDLSAAPGAHRAESYPGDAARAQTQPDSPIPPQSVFGTAAPVEPQPSTPWNNGMTSPGTPRGFNTPDQDSGPRFSPVTPSSVDSAGDRARPAVEHPADFADASNPSSAQPDSTRRAGVVRPQVAPPGFTEVPRETAPSPRQPDSLVTPATGREAADEIPAEEAGTPGQWQAPSGFTAVPTPAASPSEPSAPSDSAETDSTGPESGEPQADTRNEIENWMAQLRSSRRGTPADGGRHHGNEGRTVSVNELLRRREDD